MGRLSVQYGTGATECRCLASRNHLLQRLEVADVDSSFAELIHSVTLGIAVALSGTAGISSGTGRLTAHPVVTSCVIHSVHLPLRNCCLLFGHGHIDDNSYYESDSHGCLEFTAQNSRVSKPCFLPLQNQLFTIHPIFTAYSEVRFHSHRAS